MHCNGRKGLIVRDKTEWKKRVIVLVRDNGRVGLICRWMV